MSEPKYKPGDMVVISEEGQAFGFECVLIIKAEQCGDSWRYDFVIPERRGSVPEALIDRIVAHNMKIPKWQETEWRQP